MNKHKMLDVINNAIQKHPKKLHDLTILKWSMKRIVKFLIQYTDNLTAPEFNFFHESDNNKYWFTNSLHHGPKGWEKIVLFLPIHQSEDFRSEDWYLPIIAIYYTDGKFTMIYHACEGKFKSYIHKHTVIFDLKEYTKLIKATLEKEGYEFQRPEEILKFRYHHYFEPIG